MQLMCNICHPSWPLRLWSTDGQLMGNAIGSGYSDGESVVRMGNWASLPSNQTVEPNCPHFSDITDTCVQ